MTLLEAAILGIVQGVTEWLPVSSTAHLILVPRALGFPHRGGGPFTFDVLVQWGTVVAVVAYFRADFARMLRGAAAGVRAGRPLGSADARLFWWVALGTLPILPVGLALRGFVRDLHDDPVAVAWILLAATPVLFIGERWGRRVRAEAEAGPRDALWVGLAQAVAILPGVSRSAATMGGAMLRGFTREAAARLSFLLSVPALVAAGVVAAWDVRHAPPGGDALAALGVGFALAAATGYATIHFLLGYLRRRPLTDFAWYRVLAALAMLLLLR